MVAQAARELGGVDILVNNAGIQHVAPVEEFPVEKWDAVIAINLSAAFHAIRAALPHMKARNWGRIINVASTHGLVASAQKSAYVAAKHGILGLTKVVALETATTGITCNAICPGWVLTPLVQKQIDAIARPGKARCRCRKDEAARREATLARVRDAGSRSARRRFSCARKPRRRSAASRCRSTEAGPPNEDHLTEGRRGADPRRRERDDRRVHGRGHARAPGGRARAPGQARTSR